MIDNVPIIPPTTITIVSTYKCTAACKNCCFQCSPNKNKRLSFNEMKVFIDSCMAEYSKSLKVLVITGGECMLFFNDVKRIISYASSLGLLTRIVTNGFWATSYWTAYMILKNLCFCGLNEINFSTGDDHQQWIPFKNIRNAILASIRLGLNPIVNVETHDTISFNIQKILKRDKVLSTHEQKKTRKIRTWYMDALWQKHHIL